jgi:hypothetical protein
MVAVAVSERLAEIKRWRANDALPGGDDVDWLVEIAELYLPLVEILHAAPVATLGMGTTEIARELVKLDKDRSVRQRTHRGPARGEVVSLRYTTAELDLIEAAAADRDQTITDYIRSITVAQARTDLEGDS